MTAYTFQYSKGILFYKEKIIEKATLRCIFFFGTNRKECTGGSFDRDVLEKLFKWLKDSRKIKEKGMGFDVYLLIWNNVILNFRHI